MSHLLSHRAGPRVDDADTREQPAVRVDPPRHVEREALLPDQEAEEVVVRRNGRVSLGLAGVTALLSAAYFARAVTEASIVDWALCLLLTGLTWAHVFSFLDSRLPLLVADSHGIRIRLGRTWRGMAWSDLEEVEHTPRRGLFHDGRLVAHGHGVEYDLAGRSSKGQLKQAAANGNILLLLNRHGTSQFVGLSVQSPGSGSSKPN